MNLDVIVQSIDEEIDRLQRARSLLTGHTPPLKRGLPDAAPARKRRRMSADGQARIVAAQKARWAKVKRGS